MSQQERSEEYYLIKKFIFRAAGWAGHEERPEDYGVYDAIEDAERRLNKVEQIEERMDQLEHGWAQLVTDLPTSKQSKRQKMYSVVAYALENGKRWSGGFSVTRDTAAGAADCSTRHALNLFDELEEYGWAEKSTTGDQAKLQIDTGDKSTAAFVEMLTTVFEGVDEE